MKRQWQGQVEKASERTAGWFRLLVYTLILAAGGLQVAIIPLLPSYVHRFALSGLDQGVLLAASGLTTLLVSLPAGALSDRFGARHLTLAAGWIMALSAVAEAAAPNFTMLLVSRLLFGVGYGIVWTAGLAWLQGAQPNDSALGGTVVSSGVGGVVGPAMAGYMAQSLGVATPLLVCALVFAAVTIGLGVVRVGDAAPAERLGALRRVRSAFSARSTVAATLGVVMAGVVASFLTLLATADLHADGDSAGSIGLAFAVAGGLYVVGSLGAARLGSKLVSPRSAYLAMAALTLTLLPVVLTGAASEVIGVLCLAAALRAVIWTVSYPLGADGAERTGAGLGVVMGVMNGAWALTTVVSPIAAGAMLGPFGSRVTYAAALGSCVLTLAVGWYVLRARLSQVEAEPEAEASPPSAALSAAARSTDRT